MLSADGEPLTRNDIYAMELMPYSSLEDLIKKAARAGTHFKNEELWKIFQCRRLKFWWYVIILLGSDTHVRINTVLKSCIALAYPDRWGGENIQDETIPRGDDGRPLPIQNAIIHFDISTDNGKQNSPVVQVHMIKLIPSQSLLEILIQLLGPSVTTLCLFSRSDHIASPVALHDLTALPDRGLGSC